ncbi:MAG: ATP-binding protein [Isosphaeraceae bacterium]
MNAEERELEIARSLFREANDAFFLFDPESQRVVDLNPAAQRLTGLEKHAACTMSLTDLFASASADGLDRLVEALDETGFSHSREGYYLRRIAGSPLPVNISTSRIHTEPRPIGLVVARDISDRQGVKEELRQAEEANRAKSEFLSNVSHEIRTPLSVLLGFAELLGEHPSVQACPSEVLEYIGAIQEHGKVLLALVNDLLDLARIEAGKLRMVREPCSVSQIVNDLVASFRARAAARRLTLETLIQGEIPRTIATDRLRIHQVLMNLLDNAIKFTPQGVIRISAEVKYPAGSDPLLQLKVSDTGIGMTSAETAGLFQPFYQVRPTPRESPHGTGLGLAICQRLAHQLGGDLTVRSVPGAGSTFTLTVPVSVPVEQAVAADPAIPPPNRSDRERAPTRLKARVLLAEDHDANRQIMNLRLSRAGAEVVPARNGAEALARVREAAQQGRPIEAVIMDMEMPVLDGYEAVRQLRALGFTAPIIAVTAYAMSKDREECLSLGCNEHISKPIDWDLFLGKLAGLLAARPDRPRG